MDWTRLGKQTSRVSHHTSRHVSSPHTVCDLIQRGNVYRASVTISPHDEGCSRLRHLLIHFRRRRLHRHRPLQHHMPLILLQVAVFLATDDSRTLHQFKARPHRLAHHPLRVRDTRSPVLQHRSSAVSPYPTIRIQATSRRARHLRPSLVLSLRQGAILPVVLSIRKTWLRKLKKRSPS